jgi:ABC-type branched-subunit amino acid transport system substrate-binding protein
MRRPHLLALAIALGTAACATSKPPPRAGGLEPAPVATAPSPDAAREAARLRAEAPTMAPDRAAEAWEQLARRYPTAAEAPAALDEAARLWMRAQKPIRAAGALAEMLSRYPAAARSADASVRYGLALLEAGRPAEAMSTLQPAWEETPAQGRGDLAVRIASAAEVGKEWSTAARWWNEAAAAEAGERRARDVERGTLVVNNRLAPAEAAALQRDLPRDAPLAAALAARAARATRSEPRLVGVAVPLSGKFKGWGEAIVQGVSLALPESSGFRVVSKDTRGEPDGSAEALEQLAAEGAVAVIGGVTNAEALRAAGAAQQLGLPLLSLSKVEGVTEGRPFVFRLMLTASAQAVALADWAVTRRGMKQFAVLWPDVPYGNELMSAFWDEVEARGGEFRGAGSYEADRTNFGPLVRDIVGKGKLEERADWAEAQKEIYREVKDPYRRAKALEKARKDLPPIVDFDALFIPDFARGVSLLAPALAVEDVVTTCDPRELERIRRATGREVRVVQLLGGNGWDDPALVEKAGRYVECAVLVDGFYAGSERPETRRFVSAFQERFGRTPTILEASAYDAARMVAQAVERDKAQGREAVRGALAATRAFPGATGELAFDARGEPVRALFFLTIEKGALRELRPEEMATGPSLGP